MATFFGEVVFGSTRAFTEDDEDSEASDLFDRYETKLSLHNEALVKSKFNKVLISFGSLANEYLECCLKSCKSLKVGEIVFEKVTTNLPEDTGDFHPRVLKPTKLFQLSCGALICLASSDTTLSLANNVAKEVLSLVGKSSPIIVLHSNHLSKLNNNLDEAEYKQCLVYKMEVNSEESSSFPLLPQPSTLDNIPAAVLTLALIEDRPCSVYAAFTESLISADVDLVAESFNSVLSSKDFDECFKFDRKILSKDKRKPYDDSFDRYL